MPDADAHPPPDVNIATKRAVDGRIISVFGVIWQPAVAEVERRNQTQENAVLPVELHLQEAKQAIRSALLAHCAEMGLQVPICPLRRRLGLKVHFHRTGLEPEQHPVSAFQVFLEDCLEGVVYESKLQLRGVHSMFEEGDNISTTFIVDASN